LKEESVGGDDSDIFALEAKDSGREASESGRCAGLAARTEVLAKGLAEVEKGFLFELDGDENGFAESVEEVVPLKRASPMLR
jgi:hypothetical protein